MLVNDVCTYKKGDRNKIGVPKVSAGEVELDKNDNPVLDASGNQIVRKKDSTSWDSFSYAIQMGHNVWSHVNAVQEANRQYDAGVIPNMLVQEKFDRITFRDVVEEIFSKTTKEESLAVIDEYSKFWMAIPGTRGAIGKKTVNSSTFFDALFDVEETVESVDELDETKLEELEDEQL